MKNFFALISALAAAVACADAADPVALPQPASVTGVYRNLFTELLGKTDAEVDAKIEAYWQSFFYGDPATKAVFYPIHDDMAYITDVGNRDARTEGMSYGMMICVQTNHQKEFNMIWKFAKTYMYNNSGAQRGFFNWNTRTDGTTIGRGPAPDGEQWFTMALFFAAHRWGNGEGIYNYEAEAQAILTAMLHHDEFPDQGAVGNMFDPTAKMVNFGPGSTTTDASYHLPMFYDLWARWANEARDRAFFADAAKVSRQFYMDVADPNTGLMPNQNPIPGAANRGRRGGAGGGAGGFAGGGRRGGGGANAPLPAIDAMTTQLTLTPEQMAGIAPLLDEITKAQAALTAAQTEVANPRTTLINRLATVLTPDQLVQLKRYNARYLAERVSAIGGGPGGGGGFAEDAWRTFAYPALDYSWWGADPREVEQSTRLLKFLSLQPEENWPYHFNIDGTPTLANDDSPGMHATAAVAGLATDPALAKPFVQHLWDMPIADDSDPKRDHTGDNQYQQKGLLRSHRYYDGLLEFLAILEVSGHFRVYAPGDSN
jgi:endo-1,4-beta-D-glucanase Y